MPLFAKIPNSHSLFEFRHQLLARLQSEGLQNGDADDFVLAINEIASNALIHGEADVQVWLGKNDQKLICEVTDGGSGIHDVEIGYAAPELRSTSKRGIWVARQLTNATEFYRDERGFVVKLEYET